MRSTSRNPINFVTEKLDSNRMVITTGRENFNDIAAHSKATTLKINVVSIKLNINQVGVTSVLRSIVMTSSQLTAHDSRIHADHLNHKIDDTEATTMTSFRSNNATDGC